MRRDGTTTATLRSAFRSLPLLGFACVQLQNHSSALSDSAARSILVPSVRRHENASQFPPASSARPRRVTAGVGGISKCGSKAARIAGTSLSRNPESSKTPPARVFAIRSGATLRSGPGIMLATATSACAQGRKRGCGQTGHHARLRAVYLCGSAGGTCAMGCCADENAFTPEACLEAPNHSQSWRTPACR